MPRCPKSASRGSAATGKVNGTDGAGKRRFKTLPTHAAATKFLRSVQAEADAVRTGAAPMVNVDRTGPELIELWAEVKHAKRTLVDDQGRTACT